MPRYVYSAKSQPNKTIQGEIEAESEQDAINKISKTGLFPVSIQPEVISLHKETISPFRKISKKDLTLFTGQLSNLIESGVNILTGFNIISNQTANRYFRAILSDISSKIKDGKSLSDSMSAYPDLFSSLYTSMVRTGEAGGNIGQVLRRLADFLEKQEEFKNSVRAALTYPFFILVVSALTIVVLVGFVIPRLVSMFEDLGQALPLPTKILINISGFLRIYWWLILALISICVFSLKRIYQGSLGKLSLDKFKLEIPLLGKIILKTEISRMMRTLSLLISSGIPITTSLDISLSVIENEIIKSDSQKFKEQISGGASLSSAFKNSKHFPEFATNIVAMGEETGSLDKALMRVAEDYEKDVDRSLKSLTRLLEPLIILVMGLIVGFIVLSMLLPIFQINLIAR